MELIENKVEFDEIKHVYMLDGKQLMGITGLIHAYTGLGCYPEADEYTRNISIPQAGARGTALHEAIEYYDVTGIMMTENTVTWKEGLTGKEHTETVRVKEGVEHYARHMIDEQKQNIANEYCVTDGEKWASNIDNVWCKRSAKRKVTLVDTKTNNLKYYPGGKEALKEYLAWQLSIYAYLFEKQNPTLKVDALGCNWIRGEEHEYWQISRHEDKKIEEILACTWKDEDGKIKYFDKDGNELMKETEKKPEYEISDDENELLTEIYQKTKAVNEMTEQLNAMKERLMQIMTSKELKSMDTGLMKVTYTPESTSKRFDSTRFKAEQKEMYEAYIKESVSKATLKVTIR